MSHSPLELGEFALLATVDFMWNTIDATEASVVRGTDGTIRVYKDASDVQRTSSAGITDTESADSLTGLNRCIIDLSDDTHVGFYAAGSTYHVVVQGMVLGAVTQNICIARFTIAASPILRQSDVVDDATFISLVAAAVRNPSW